MTLKNISRWKKPCHGGVGVLRSHCGHSERAGHGGRTSRHRGNRCRGLGATANGRATCATDLCPDRAMNLRARWRRASAKRLSQRTRPELNVLRTRWPHDRSYVVSSASACAFSTTALIHSMHRHSARTTRRASRAFLRKRIEIVRGPATLLYGSGSSGGLINVIDNRVVREPSVQTDQRRGRARSRRCDWGSVRCRMDRVRQRARRRARGCISS